MKRCMNTFPNPNESDFYLRVVFIWELIFYLRVIFIWELIFYLRVFFIWEGFYLRVFFYFRVVFIWRRRFSFERCFLGWFYFSDFHLRVVLVCTSLRVRDTSSDHQLHTSTPWQNRRHKNDWKTSPEKLLKTIGRKNDFKKMTE